MSITKNIGKKIRNFRKQKNMSIAQLGEEIYKSKATISKYENGEIIIDIVTLHEIASALQINVEQLLEPNLKLENYDNKKVNGFFEGSDTFYSYFFDGRNNKVTTSVLKIASTTNSDNKAKAYLYMNCHNIDEYEICEYAYSGYIEHYNIITNIILNNVSTPIEHSMISILSPFNDSQIKYGLFSSISTRPVMPISLKMLFSKKPLEINDDLINKLLINDDDIRSIKLYNKFTVNQDF
ncbi:transcriptional regulator with XRE-family HTH domain [Bacilli bacterium PM5-3]|nr:transcriptional regulator with XRE-family HTH domain [Bacilli bacterium PM5-3]